MDNSDSSWDYWWLWLLVGVLIWYFFFNKPKDSYQPQTDYKQQQIYQLNQQVQDLQNQQQDQINTQKRKQRDLENQLEEQRQKQEDDQWWTQYCASYGEYYNGVTCSKR